MRIYYLLHNVLVVVRRHPLRLPEKSALTARVGTNNGTFKLAVASRWHMGQDRDLKLWLRTT